VQLQVQHRVEIYSTADTPRDDPPSRAVDPHRHCSHPASCPCTSHFWLQTFLILSSSAFHSGFLPNFGSVKHVPVAIYVDSPEHTQTHMLHPVPLASVPRRHAYLPPPRSAPSCSLAVLTCRSGLLIPPPLTRLCRTRAQTRGLAQHRAAHGARIGVVRGAVILAIRAMARRSPLLCAPPPARTAVLRETVRRSGGAHPCARAPQRYHDGTAQQDSMQGCRAAHTPILAPRHSVPATVGGGRRGRGGPRAGHGGARAAAPIRRGGGSGGRSTTCPRYTPRAEKAWRERPGHQSARNARSTPAVSASHHPVSVFVTFVRFRSPPALQLSARLSRVLSV
jgi:hypothetical protein